MLTCHFRQTHHNKVNLKQFDMTDPNPDLPGPDILQQIYAHESEQWTSGGMMDHENGDEWDEPQSRGCENRFGRNT